MNKSHVHYDYMLLDSQDQLQSPIRSSNELRYSGSGFLWESKRQYSKWETSRLL